MKYDVTIVGAGPAGSTTAKFLAEKGFKTLLLDKEKFPREKPCGGGLPIRVLQRFPYVINDNIIEAYSSSGTIFSPSLQHQIEINKNTPIIAMVLRKKFDFELVKFAIEAGAIFQEATPASAVRISNDTAQVTLDLGRKIDSEIIVGADGVNSTLVRNMGLRASRTEKGICILQEFEVDEKIMDEYFKKSRHCYIHSRFKSASGYGWVFPKKEHLNIGFGIINMDKNQQPKHNLLNWYQDYITLLKEKNLIPQHLKETPVKGGALLTHPLEKTYADRFLLVGDAAGFINPLTGEGIYYAMVSGQIAAEIITEALEKKQTTQEFLSQYQTRWQNDFGKDINLILKVVQRGSMEYVEKVFKIAYKDPVLTDLMMGVITGQLSVQQYKWKIVRRFFYSSLKNRLHLLK
ncbi:MAG TPA: geranylgeranyl reductase family protein [Candidatus Thermoplasmatota archaeon]|nr:geranylgeranyl reductase family protein [Candidatus Thermoplasmatota archaeon]